MYSCDVHFYTSIFAQCMCVCCTHLFTYAHTFKDVKGVFSCFSAKDEKRKKKERRKKEYPRKSKKEPQKRTRDTSVLW